MELSTLVLEEMQLPMNLNLIQHPLSSAAPSFFFFNFDFPTVQSATLIESGPNTISLETKK
jgi:hypothetical protein